MDKIENKTANANDFGKSLNKNNSNNNEPPVNNTSNDINTNNELFPVEVFPEQIQQIIIDTNKGLDFPIDFIGASILSAVSIATGNTYKVKARNGWNESALIYIALVGSAGTNKSHPLDFAMKPIQKRDSLTFKEYKIKKNEFDKFKSLSTKKREEQGIEEIKKPILKKYLVSDFTPEALAQIHEFNKKSIGVVNDELAGWFKNFNRYSKGNDEEIWLSIWSGKSINIDRKTSDPIFIAHPFISVVGTIQTKILIELSKNNRSKNGFMDRILFAFPDNLIKPYWNKKEIDNQTIISWETILNNILNINLKLDENFNPLSKILNLNSEAENNYIIWFNKNVDLMNNTDNEAIKSIYSKLDMYVFRLALIIEMSKFACNESELNNISENSINGAIKLIEYFRKTALKVHSIIHNDNDVMLSLDKAELLKALPNEFTTGEGIIIAKKLDISERTYKAFLKDNINVLFIYTKYGNYKKI